MSNLKWWQKTIVYELYPSSFKDSNDDGLGDIRGVIEKLDYLKSLNIGAIWLTPVYVSPMIDNGYDIEDYYSIDPRFGTMEDMDELIKEANKRNIKIVMDLVFNHTSDKCSWFKESKKSKDNKYADYYMWQDPKDNKEPNNIRSLFEGSAWQYCKERNQYYLHTFFKEQPDLNWENPEVRKALYDVANFWINKGVGGFRIDAITFIKKPKIFKDKYEIDGSDGMSSIIKHTANYPGILEFLNEFKENVQDDKDIFTVAEAIGVKLEELPNWVGDNGVFNMIFRFDLLNIEFVEGEIWYKTKKCTIKDIKRVISNEQKQINEGLWSPIFFENHDRPRSINHFFQNDIDSYNKSKVLLTLLFTLQGTPFLYQGEELGLTNVVRKSPEEFNDGYSRTQYRFAVENGISKESALASTNRYSRDNTRGPIPWDASENGGFSKIKPWIPAHDKYKEMNVETEDKDVNSPLSWTRRVSSLRLNTPCLLQGKFIELLENDENIFAYKRVLDDEEMIMIINMSDKKLSIPNVVNSYQFVLSSHEKHTNNVLLPYEALIYKK